MRYDYAVRPVEVAFGHWRSETCPDYRIYTDDLIWRVVEACNLGSGNPYFKLDGSDSPP